MHNRSVAINVMFSFLKKNVSQFLEESLLILSRTCVQRDDPSFARLSSQILHHSAKYLFLLFSPEANNRYFRILFLCRVVRSFMCDSCTRYTNKCELWFVFPPCVPHWKEFDTTMERKEGPRSREKKRGRNSASDDVAS